MANLNYLTDVAFDISLKNLGTDETGLVVNGEKTTAGVPPSTSGYFSSACIIQNTFDGTVYVNIGSSSLPVWAIIGSSSANNLTLLGTIIGADMNLASSIMGFKYANKSITIKYSNLVPGVGPGSGCLYLDTASMTGSFNPGVTVEGQLSGATGMIDFFGMCAISPGLTAFSLQNVWGTFLPGEIIDSSSGGSGICDNANITYPIGNFYPGENIIGGTSFATGLIIADDGVNTMKITPISGTFQVVEQITGSMSGTTADTDAITPDLFQVGEIVSNPGINQSTAEVLTDNGVNGMTVINAINTQFNPFTVGQPLTGGTSGTVAEITVVLVTPGGDQLITLSGGSNYLIEKVIITNSLPIPLTTASGAEVWTKLNRTGNFMFIYGSSLPLSASDDYIDMSKVTMKTIISPVYFSLSIPQGAPAKADVYVYGFVIN